MTMTSEQRFDERLMKLVEQAVDDELYARFGQFTHRTLLGADQLAPVAKAVVRRLRKMAQRERKPDEVP